MIKNVVKNVNETASPPLNFRLSKTLCKSGLTAWTFSPYRSKMSVKTANSVVSYWGQTGKKQFLKERKSLFVEFFWMKCWWVSLRVWWICFAIWTGLMHLCRGFVQIALCWETRQTHLKRCLPFEIALCRSFFFWMIFWQMLMSLLKSY